MFSSCFSFISNTDTRIDLSLFPFLFRFIIIHYKLKMNTLSSRRSLSCTSAISSGRSAPVKRRRKPRQTSNTTLQNTSTNSTRSSARILQRLQSKPKTVRSTNSKNNHNSNEIDQCGYKSTSKYYKF